jgi:hypothetical protein
MKPNYILTSAVILGLIALLTLIYVRGQAVIVNPPPPGDLHDIESFIAISGFYDEDKMPIGDQRETAIVNGVPGISYIKLGVTVKNTDTYPLELSIVSSTPDNIVYPTDKKTSSPGQTVRWESGFIDVSKYMGEQKFCVVVKSEPIQYIRTANQITGCLNVIISQETPGSFEIVLDTEIDDSVPVTPPTTLDLGASEKAFYDRYLQLYVSQDGKVISNHVPVSWCPNGCIGCGSDVTSEAVSRLANYAVMTGDKSIFDRETTYFLNTMKHSNAGFMMWKLDNDGTPGSCGGMNSAVDSELIYIKALLEADAKWGTHPSGIRYRAIARGIMDAMKTGLIEGKYIPYCMYPQGSEARACENKVFLGYLNLPSLKKMCTEDTFWCNIYAQNKILMIGAVQDNGVYSAYNVDTNQYTWENADIHPNWVIKHLAMDGSSDAWIAVKPFYDITRAAYFNEGQKMCQEFEPGAGCKKTNPPIRVYANYLEIASARNDIAFRDALISTINQKRLETLYSPLANPDNYGNIVVMESYAEARESGGIVG